MTVIEQLIIECQEMIHVLNKTAIFWVSNQAGNWHAQDNAGPICALKKESLEVALLEYKEQVKQKIVIDLDKKLQAVVNKEQESLKQANLLTEEADKIRAQKQKYLNP